METTKDMAKNMTREASKNVSNAANQIQEKVQDKVQDVKEKASSALSKWQRQTMPQRAQDSSYINVGRWERIASIFFGGLLVLRALKNRRFGSLFSGAFGTALIQRGVKGHCNLYERTGVSSASEA